MAKDQIEIDIKVDDNGTTQKATLNSKKAGQQFDDTTKKADKYHTGQKGVAQATANSTKAFSKMQGGMTGLVGTYAEIASRVFALTAAFQFLKNASDVTNLIAGQEALGSVTGVAYKTITADLKAATDGQLAYADAARAAAIGTAAGLNAGQLTALGTAAKNTSNALGRDLRDSFDRLIRGVTKAEPELLDELGIILRLETATEKYAQSVGKSANDLSTFQKSQAVFNEVLGQAEEKFGRIEELMDPSAASLNRFLTSFDDVMNSLKVGSMQVLRPIFDFLSNNTAALVGTLGLLGTTILRSILPNMNSWKQSTEETLTAANANLTTYRNKVTESRTALDKFVQSQKASRDTAVGMAGKAMGDFGTVTKSGGGAKDFFSGASDTKRARSNAKRVLKAAEAEYRQFGRVVTGMLKGYNAEQLADLRASYNMRIQLLEQEKVKHKFTLREMRMHWDVWAANANAKIASVKATFAGFAAGAVKVGSKLLSAMGWASIIGMGVGFVKSLMRQRLPDHLRDTLKEADDLTESLKTLNDELVRMESVQASGLLTADQFVSQIGKAAANADLHGRILTFQKLQLSLTTEELAAQKTELLKVAKSLADLSPKYKEYYDILAAGGTIDEDRLKQLKDQQDRMIEVGQAVDTLANSFENLRTIVKSNLTAGLNPFADLQKGAEEIIEKMSLKKEGIQDLALPGIDAQIAEGKKRLEELKKLQIDTRDSGSRAIDQLQMPMISSGFFEFMGGNLKDVPVQLERMRAQKDLGVDLPTSETEKLNLIKQQQKALDDLNAKRAEGLKSVQEVGKNEQLVLEYNTEAARIVEAQNKSRDAQLTLLQNQDSLMNKNITVAERLQTLQLKENQDKQASAKASDAVLKAEMAIAVAKLDTSDKGKEALKAARHNLSVAQANLDIQTKTAQINEEIRQKKQAQLELERELNPLILSKNNSELALLEAQRLKKDISSGANDFGFTQASLERQQQGAILSQKISIAQNAALIATTKEQSALKNKDKFTVKELNNLSKKTKLANENVKKAQQELDIHNAAVKIAENNRNAQIEELQFRNEMFSLNPLQEEFNKAILDMKKQGITLSKQEQEVLLQQLQTIKDQSDLLARKEALKSAIGDNLANVIADAIRGNITSLKDAVKQLAEGILNDMVDIISKQLAQKALSFFAPKLFTSPAATMASAHSAGATAIGTAITTNAGTAATTIGTAITTGTTTLTTGLATAFTTGAATLTTAIAAACAACSMGCSGGGGGGEDGSNSFSFNTRPSETGIDTGIGTIDAAGQAKKLGSQGLKESMNEAREQLKEDLKNSVKEGLDIGMPKALEAGGPKLGQSLADKFTSFADKLGGNLKDMLGGTLDNLMGGLDGMLSGIMGNLGGMLQGLGSGLGGLLGGIGGGIGSLFGMFFADGGIASYGRKMPGYSTGGIAQGSKAGYPAILHGTEAVVPLPNGKSIPVEMSNSNNSSNMNQTNNISISIAQDGSSKEDSDGDKDNESLGRAISQAVQQELQNQKRSGGILSPYGVA